MAHSIELRKLAVEYYKTGHTPEEAREVYKVSRASLFRYKKELESGACPKPKQTRKRKITSKKLKQVVKERSDAYLREYAVTLGCTPQAVFSALKRHKITYKKRRSPDLNDIEKSWSNFKRALPDIVPKYSCLFDAVCDYFQSHN